MLYFKKDSNYTVIFSDKHYRQEAINALGPLVKLFSAISYDNKDNIFTYGVDVDRSNHVPTITIFLTDTERKRQAFEYGVKIDATGEKWEAAYREQVEFIQCGQSKQSVQSVQSVQYVKSEQHENAEQVEEIEQVEEAEIIGIYLEKYVKNCCRTECSYDDAVERATNWIDLLHGAMGLCTETGELQDTVKKYVFYGKELDRVNIEEELGDIFWYCAIICKSLDLDFQTIMEKNIAKLKKRYPEKFTEDKALNRDLEAERKVLENE